MISLSQKLDEQRLDELATRIRAGTVTSEEKEELTAGFVRLAYLIARSLARGDSTRTDDYFSCGLFGIAYAIYHAKERLKDQNIAAWIVYQIRDHIKKFRRRDHLVPVPAQTYFVAKREGRSLPAPPAVLSMSGIQLAEKRSELYDLREAVFLCAKDTTDEQIVQLRIEGFKDTEIADKLSMPKTAVNNRRRAIEDRYEQLLRDEE